MGDDRTKAEALRIAMERLDAIGWKYNHSDIGRVAAEIINAMNSDIKGS